MNSKATSSFLVICFIPSVAIALLALFIGLPTTNYHFQVRGIIYDIKSNYTMVMVKQKLG